MTTYCGKYILYLAFTILPYRALFAQTWIPAGNNLGDPFTWDEFYQDVYDLHVYHDTLYAGGKFGVNYWDGYQWHEMAANGLESVLTLCDFDNRLYRGGEIPFDENYTHIEYWSGDEWEQIGGVFSRDYTSDIKKIYSFNGKLYTTGYFTNYETLDGEDIQTNYIAFSEDGIEWQKMGEGFNNIPWDIEGYEDLLIASGDFTSSGTVLLQHIAKWDGTAWSPLDTALHISNGARLFTYNDLLLMGNVFDTVNGIPANGVAAWNDDSISVMGDSRFHQVYDFEKFNGDLFVSASLKTDLPFIYEKVVLKFADGLWNIIGDDFNDIGLALQSYDDDLYLGGWFTKYGEDSTGHIARYTTDVSVDEPVTNTAIRIFPNPATDMLSIDIPVAYLYVEILIADMYGRAVMRKMLATEKEIDISVLLPGTYTLKLKTQDQTFSTQLIIVK